MTDPPDIASVVVVGGCGSLGHRIVGELLEIRPLPRIVVFDIQTKMNRKDGIEYHDVDITDRNEVWRAFGAIKPQVVIHTASPYPGSPDLRLYLRVNVEGTRILLECAKMHGAKAFIYTSSASVISDSVTDLHLGDETYPLQYLPSQKDIYSHSKALADKLVLEFNSTSMPTCTLRPSGMFGRKDASTFAYASSAAQGKYKYQIGDGSNLFDFTYNENVAWAHILAAQALLKSHMKEKDYGMKVAGEAFIITNDVHSPFWDFARAIGAAAGHPTDRKKVTTLPLWLGLLIALIVEWVVWTTSLGRKKRMMNRVGLRYSVMTRTFDIEKAKRVLGYVPRVGLDEGIRLAGGSYREELKKDV